VLLLLELVAYNRQLGIAASKLNGSNLQILVSWPARIDALSQDGDLAL